MGRLFHLLLVVVVVVLLLFFEQALLGLADALAVLGAEVVAAVEYESAHVVVGAARGGGCGCGCSGRCCCCHCRRSVAGAAARQRRESIRFVFHFS